MPFHNPAAVEKVSDGASLSVRLSTEQRLGVARAARLAGRQPSTWARIVLVEASSPRECATSTWVTCSGAPPRHWGTLAEMVAAADALPDMLARLGIEGTALRRTK